MIAINVLKIPKLTSCYPDKEHRCAENVHWSRVCARIVACEGGQFASAG